jgi:hypothetical protein
MVFTDIGKLLKRLLVNFGQRDFETRTSPYS